MVSKFNTVNKEINDSFRLCQEFLEEKKAEMVRTTDIIFAAKQRKLSQYSESAHSTVSKMARVSYPRVIKNKHY